MSRFELNVNVYTSESRLTTFVRLNKQHAIHASTVIRCVAMYIDIDTTTPQVRRPFVGGMSVDKIYALFVNTDWPSGSVCVGRRMEMSDRRQLHPNIMAMLCNVVATVCGVF